MKNNYLIINTIILPLADDYNVKYEIIDKKKQTEAGTIQREIIRKGVVKIDVSFSVSAKWLKILSSFAILNILTVEFFDTITLELKSTKMFITNYTANLYKDTLNKGLWKVTFTLNEY